MSPEPKLVMQMPSDPRSLVEEKRPDSGQYALLRSVPLFAALDDAAAEELCGYLHPITSSRPSVSLRVGAMSGDAMYFIERWATQLWMQITAKLVCCGIIERGKERHTAQ